MEAEVSRSSAEFESRSFSNEQEETEFPPAFDISSEVTQQKSESESEGEEKENQNSFNQNLLFAAAAETPNDDSGKANQKSFTAEAFSPTVQRKEDEAESSSNEGAEKQPFIPSSVNIHKDSSQASSLGARAFTQGNDIHFAPNEFQPEQKQGQELIGHELMHVVQQSNNQVKANTSINGVGVNDDKGLEKEADDFGTSYAQGDTSKISQLKSSGFSGESFSLNSTPAQREPDGGAGDSSPATDTDAGTTDSPAPAPTTDGRDPDMGPAIGDQETDISEYAANIMVMNVSTERRLFKTALGTVLFNGNLAQVLHLVTDTGLTALMNPYWEMIRGQMIEGAVDFDTTGADAIASLESEASNQERFFYVSTNAASLQEKLIRQFAYTPASQFRQLELLAKVYKGSFNATHLANELYNSMYGGVFGWGTDEDRAFKALTGLSSLEVTVVKKAYRSLYDRNLESDLDDEMSSGADKDRWQALLSGDAAKDAAAALHNAMFSGWSGIGLGTDESTIMSTLRNKTPEQVQAIKDAYKELYGRELEDDFENELGGHDALRATALTESNTSQADAIAIDQAMNGTWMGLGFGTDEDAIEQVYTDIRTDVETAPGSGTMTTEQINAEVLARNQQVETEYNDTYSVEGDNSSALRNAFDNEMTSGGGYNNLMNAYADNNLTAIDAGKLQVENEATFYASDDNINDVLENQYKRAHSELMRDVWPVFQLQISGQTTDPYEQAALRRQYMAIIHDQALVLARQYMSDLGSEYETSEHSGSFGYDMRINTFGNHKTEALVDGDSGYLSPAQQIWYAIDRDGTDEAAVKTALQGKTLAELQVIDTEFQTLSGGRTLRQALLESHFLGIHELSGRDWYDVRLMLDHGTPTDAAGEMAYNEARVQTEHDNAGWFEFGTDPQVQVMDSSLEYMQEQYAILNDPNSTPEQIALAQQLFGNSTDNIGFAIGSYREQADAVASTATTIAAVVVGVVLAVASWGSMSAVSVALISSAVASATSMAGKFLLSGAAYGSDAFATDLGMAALDMITARMTMGLGDELLDSVPLLRSMANDRGAVSRIVAKGIAEGYESIPGGFASSLAGEIVNDQTWDQENPGASILFNTLVNTAISTGQSVAMGMIGEAAEGLRNRNGTTDPNADPGVDNVEAEEVDLSDPHATPEGDSGTLETGTTGGGETEVTSVTADLTTATTGPQTTAWDDPNITFTEFKAQYTAKYPDTSLSHDDLLLRYMRGQRLHPVTGRLRRVGPDRSHRLENTNNYDGVEAFRDTFDPDRTMDPDLTGQLYNYYDQQKWAEMEALGNSMGIQWPPGFGGFNTQFNQAITAGQTYDRYSGIRGFDSEGYPILTGSNFSPVGDDTVPFPMRALNNPEGDYDIYLQIEVVQDLHFPAETADIIPYFGQPGMGQQSRWLIPTEAGERFPTTLTELAKQGFIKITILGSPSGAHADLVGTTIP